MGTATQNLETAGLDPNECWEVLERAAASTHLSRAARLREFLFYVSCKSLKERCEVHEQEIGEVVFGRRADYDTSQDNIVRVNATELRKRINAYFAVEGAQEPLLFHIPRGSYSPVFWRRAEEPAPVLALESKEVVVAAEIQLVPTAVLVPFYRQISFLVAMMVVVCLALVVSVLAIENQRLNRSLHPWRDQPALSAFWSHFLDTSRGTDLVLADASIALYEDITGEHSSLTDYVGNVYMRQIQTLDASADRKTDLNLLVSRMNTTFGDLRAAQRIQQLDPTSKTLMLQYARGYSADSVKQHNVIFIGGQKSNPWVTLVSGDLNFTIEYDAKLNLSYIRNLKPKPGEEATYAAPENQYSSIGYSFVAYLPNPSHTGEALVVAGTDSQATYAAAEFLTSERSMAGLLKRFNSPQIPYFQVLLRNTRLNSTPLDFEILAYRIY